MEYKTLICFEFENGSYTIAEYNELENLAKRHNLDFETFLNDLAESMKVEAYTVYSSRLLD